MTPLGPFAVKVERARVDGFRAATGLPPGDAAVPATFPVVWLAAPAVRDALLALAAEPGLVPVHESQSFDYVAPLIVDETYALSLEARREPAPDRLVLAGTVRGEDGAARLHLETVLRLFSADAEAAA